MWAKPKPPLPAWLWLSSAQAVAFSRQYYELISSSISKTSQPPAVSDSSPQSSPSSPSLLSSPLGIIVGNPWVPDLKPTPIPTKYPYPPLWVWVNPWVYPEGPVGIKGTLPMMSDPWV
ncbi:hypothetical protein M378DRAFT_18242 [Amanita muscaria Koide BX008]|uniref:Uncharacterized protein n=1 Tax=Amanita muscaria (strain Koide BX008) TaxID=946122 RepID=A0A0C2WEW0_AMAMK|nr:hypothetical protein M378DRAFT_18242 [Amanita muscaria Koide BX008]